VSTPVKVGEKIPLLAHLECLDGPPLYVDAVIKRPDRSSLPGSPFDLGHEGNGVYFDNSVTMPDEDYLTVTYRIFDDAGKTIPSDAYCQVTEIITPAPDSAQVITTNIPDRIVVRTFDSRSAIGIADHGPGKVAIVDPDANVEIQESRATMKESQSINSIRSN
jgi:hypothetical protein